MSPKRPGTHRDQRSTPVSGVPTPFVKEEPTPPPQQMPPLPDDWNARLDAHEAQIRDLTSAVQETWPARHIEDEVKQIRTELSDNTRSTIRMEAVLDELVVPHMKDQMAKLDTCLHHIAASSHLAATVISLGEKIDAFAPQIAAIESEQKIAAQKFGEHDKRDQEMSLVVNDTRARVIALEQAKAVAEETGKVRKLVARQRSWWLSAKGVATVAAAIAAAIVTIIYALTGAKP